MATAQELSDKLSAEAESKKSSADIKNRNNASNVVDALASAIKSYDDPGPIKVLIVKVEADKPTSCWVLDAEADFAPSPSTSPSSSPPCSSLVKPPMHSFDHNRDVAKFDSSSMMNYCLNFETPVEDGIVVTITTDAGAHGSHVSGIVAASLNDSSMNGVAPGAQIVNLKIGDSRLGSMETGVGVVRALKEAKKRGCHIVNMSFGEAAAISNSGRIKKLIDEMIHKDNILFCASAGNNGPALTTVGAPGGCTSSIISVGAYVDTSMMESDYSMREILGGGSNYTWTSCGPAADGDNGVDIMAPGGAITSVPEWTLQKNQLMNGTSMSSPNCCGCIALLLSALIQQNIPWSVQRIKKAIFNTARVLPNLSTLIQGNGMVQVEKAYEHLMNFKDEPSEDVRFDVSINRVATKMGVYLRQHDECNKRQTYTVTVDPKWGHEDSDRSLSTQTSRVEFNMRMNLEVTSSKDDSKDGESFVTHPDHLVLMHNGRSFTIEVDPRRLTSGLHTTQLVGYDSESPERGPMFKFPITVMKPMSLEGDGENPSPNLGQLLFGPAETYRFFVTPPPGATYCDITVKDCRDASDDDSSRLVVLHAVQILPHTPYRDREKQRYLNLNPGKVTVTSVRIVPDFTIEITLARYWSALGLTEVSCDVSFGGVLPTPNKVHITQAGEGRHVTVQSLVRDENVSPSIKLSKWETYLRPTDSSISALPGDRNVLLDGVTRTYGLTLTYKLKLDEDCDATFRAPMLNGYLYESAMEAQMSMIYSESKKLLGVMDCWPESVKCEKGDITVKFMIRHDDLELLKTFDKMTLAVERDLKSPMTLQAYETHENMILGKKKFGNRSLRKGKAVSVHVGPLDQEKMPKEAVAGDLLKGKVRQDYLLLCFFIAVCLCLCVCVCFFFFFEF